MAGNKKVTSSVNSFHASRARGRGRGAVVLQIIGIQGIIMCHFTNPAVADDIRLENFFEVYFSRIVWVVYLKNARLGSVYNSPEIIIILFWNAATPDECPEGRALGLPTEGMVAHSFKTRLSPVVCRAHLRR